MYTVKQKNKYGEVVEKMLDALKELGPMTSAEICQAINQDRYQVSAVISRLRKPTKILPKRIYIKSWTYDNEKARRYPRAIFALGFGLDAIKPKPNKKENKRRYELKKNNRFIMNNVFNLGKTRDQIRQETKGIYI